MTPREAFLAERKLGIGGSDIASVFGIGYGCKRRLWFDKRGVPEDYPREETAAMKLGTILEPFFADEYARLTSRTIGQTFSEPHRDFPELRVNADRNIYMDDATTWVLEIKSVGRAVFYKIKKDGLPEDYILQLQHAMLVKDAPAGAFAVGSRDSGELLHWDVEANPDIHKAILEEGPKFWALVQNGPMPEALEPEDKRCQNCAWRLTCHGNAFAPTAEESEYETDETLAPLTREYEERRLLRKEAQELLDETKAELECKMGPRGKVQNSGGKVQFYEFTKKAYLVREHKERPLRVYPAKEKK